MYIITLTNKKTNEVRIYNDIVDINDGEKLYYRFQLNTLELEDGEYDLELTKDGVLVGVNTLYVGDYESYSLQYKRGDNTYIDITLDVKLEDGDVEVNEITMTITPSEDYDGFAKVEIDASPLYDNAFSSGYSSGSTEGFNLGYSSGKTDGYNIGYNEGEENGVANAGEIIAQTARILDITKNGTYVSQYSDPIYPDIVTGVYPNGENFYNYAQLNGAVYDTDIIGNQNTKLEFWWKPDKEFNMYHTIIGFQVDSGMIMKICETYSANELKYEYGFNAENQGSFTINNDWNHIIFSKADGLIVNGVKITDLTANWYGNVYPNVFINASFQNEINSNANGYFGMIKIDDNIIIPTADGFENVTTNQILQILKRGSYSFTDNQPIIPEGNLIKTVNVNVQPKIDVGKYGIKFGNSNFTEIPEIFDFSNITSMSDMFRNTNLNTLKGIDFSTIQNMGYAFYGCGNLTNLDYFTPSNSLIYMNNTFDSCGNLRIIPNLDLSSVLDAGGLFESCGSIEEIGDIDFENATNIGGFLRNYGDGYPIRKIGVFNVPNVENIGDFFYYTFQPVIRDNLTEMGGFIGLKCNWDGGNGLDSCPYLTYQSCINILNGLADVTELGGRTLRVHSNFLTTVGDEISIGTNKGWTITV